MDEYGVIDKLWGFCNVLRDDGIGYGDYIEQLTYLLFLKIAEERGVEIPKGYDWQSLKRLSGTELREHYIKLLGRLSTEDGMLGDIFAGSLSKFREPVNLKRLITLIDEIQWSETDVDIKAAAYEGLLQKYAEEQKGAGQYFTPREVIRSVVRCMKPDIREKADFSIHDPACGTGGFLIGAYEWMLKQTNMGADLIRDDNQRLRKTTFSGQEIVLETRRLAFMNLYLHEIEANIEYGDSLAEGPHTGKRYDCILTNPPFGIKGGGVSAERGDFPVRTSNKQLNFVQHVMTIVKPNGKAAMVVPDNVLFESSAGKEIRRILLEDCQLNAILRLPIGTFSPYSTGVKANVIFFEKGRPTEEVWIYDLRTNIKNINKSNPLTDKLFEEFENCYHSILNRTASSIKCERFRKFSRKELRDRDNTLDIFWIADKKLGSIDDLPEPIEIVSELQIILQNAMDSIDEIETMLNNSKIISKEHKESV